MAVELAEFGYVGHAGRRGDAAQAAHGLHELGPVPPLVVGFDEIFDGFLDVADLPLQGVEDGGSGDCSGWNPKIGDDLALRRCVAHRGANDLSPIFSLLAAQPAPKQTALNLVSYVLRTYQGPRMQRPQRSRTPAQLCGLYVSLPLALKAETVARRRTPPQLTAPSSFPACQTRPCRSRRTGRCEGCPRGLAAGWKTSCWPRASRWCRGTDRSGGCPAPCAVRCRA